jgi:hypothetical protein
MPNSSGLITFNKFYLILIYTKWSPDEACNSHNYKKKSGKVEL